jgi:hypothetical protein
MKVNCSNVSTCFNELSVERTKHNICSGKKRLLDSGTICFAIEEAGRTYTVIHLTL